MLFMLCYRALPGKGAEALRMRHEWQEKYSDAFRKRIKVIHEFVDPSALVGCLVIEINDHKHLASLLSIQTVFGDTAEFNLHPVIDIREALKTGMEEPTGLL